MYSDVRTFLPRKPLLYKTVKNPKGCTSVHFLTSWHRNKTAAPIGLNVMKWLKQIELLMVQQENLVH